MTKTKNTLILTILLLMFTININFAYCIYDNPPKTKDVYISPEVSPEFEGLYALPDNPPDIASPSSILIEASRGQILYEKNSSEKLHISAACKIMTALVVIEKMKDQLDTKVTISKESTDTEGAALKLVVGEKYSVEDLLYAVTLRSANDAANALAEHVGGDLKGFVSMMNDKATELELKDTHFSNPTGLYDETQYTTAHDISFLVFYALNNQTFNKIFSSKSRPWTNSDGTFSIMVNQNNLFWEYDGIDGGKTGFNNKEQYTAITTATRGNQRLISVVLDSPENMVFEDSKKLFDFGFQNFRRDLLVRKGDSLKSIEIGGKKVNLVCMNDVYYTFPIGKSYMANYEINLAKNLEPPIKKNLSIGVARYTLSDGTIIDINLYPDTEISPPDDFITIAKRKAMENKEILYIVLFLIAIEIILLFYNIIRLIGRMIKKLRH